MNPYSLDQHGLLPVAHKQDASTNSPIAVVPGSDFISVRCTLSIPSKSIIVQPICGGSIGVVIGFSPYATIDPVIRPGANAKTMLLCYSPQNKAPIWQAACQHRPEVDN